MSPCLGQNGAYYRVTNNNSGDSLVVGLRGHGMVQTTSNKPPAGVQLLPWVLHTSIALSKSSFAEKENVYSDKDPFPHLSGCRKG